MPLVPSEEHIQFLVSCIKHSNQGKVDFEGVAKECNIVSKGAAAKRYERLTKTSSGSSLSKNDRSNEDAGESASTPTKTGGKRKAATPKKANTDGPKSSTPSKRSRKNTAVADAESKIKPEEKAQDSDEGSVSQNEGVIPSAGDVEVEQEVAEEQA